MMGKVTRKINVTTQVFIMVAILGVVNFFSFRHFSRADFTGEGEYTLAPASRGLVSNLDDIVTVNAYFSRDLPPYLDNLKGKIRDLLDEYGAYGGKNFKVRFVVPEDDPAMEQKMRMMGIPRVQLNILEKDQFQATHVYMGLAVFYQNRKEVIPFIQEVEDLEYQLSSTILRVTRDDAPRVGMAYGDDAGSPAPEGSHRYSFVEEELRRQYDYSAYRFKEGLRIPDDIGCLVVAGPSNLAEEDIYRLDQFVVKGGRLILLLDTIALPMGTLMPQKVDHGLGELLQKWGFEVPDEVVLDLSFNAPAHFSGGFLPFSIDYPYWPDVHPEGFDPNQPIVSQLESLVMPWTSPVTVGEGSGLEHIILAKTSPHSWTETGPFDFSPRRLSAYEHGDMGEKALVVMASGAFGSLYEESAIPEGIDEEERGLFLREGPNTSVIIAGNSRFVEDNFLRQFPGNGLFLINAVDWMADSEELIGIRSRGSTDRPLLEMSEKARAGIRFVNTWAVALMVMLAGGLRFYMRRKVITNAF